eukprot:141516_1
MIWYTTDNHVLYNDNDATRNSWHSLFFTPIHLAESQAVLPQFAVPYHIQFIALYLQWFCLFFSCMFVFCLTWIHFLNLAMFHFIQCDLVLRSNGFFAFCSHYFLSFHNSVTLPCSTQPLRLPQHDPLVCIKSTLVSP